MFKLNFGQEANEHECTCGRHYGTGEWTSEQRAAIYGRQRDRLPDFLAFHQQAFIADWENYHGRIKYDLRMTGTHTDKTIAKVGTKYLEAYFIPNVMDKPVNY